MRLGCALLLVGICGCGDTTSNTTVDLAVGGGGQDLAVSMSPDLAQGGNNDLRGNNDLAGKKWRFGGAAGIYATIIKVNTCTAHHSGATPSGNLNMATEAMAYTNLVGVKAAGPACAASGETRVVAGNAANSLLYQKVSMATPPCGGRMPLNGTPLSGVDQQAIADWIDQGAIQ
jgi:hypothetical protein